MMILSIFSWTAIVIGVLMVIIFLWAFHDGSRADKVTDVLASIVAIMLGMLLTMAFIAPETQAPVRDVLWGGYGYNASPKNPVYTPNPTAQSETDLPPIRGTESWRIQLTLKEGVDGKAFLPKDTQIQAMKAWTVDSRGKESLAVTIK